MKYTPYQKNVFYFLIIIQSCSAMKREIPCPAIEEIIPFKISNNLSPHHMYLSKQLAYNDENIPCITDLKTNLTIPINGLNHNCTPSLYINNTKIIFKDGNTAKIYDIKKNEIIQSLKILGNKLLNIVHSSFDNSILLISQTIDHHITEIFALTKKNDYQRSFSFCSKNNDTIYIFHPKDAYLFEIQKTGLMTKYKYKSFNSIQHNSNPTNLPPLYGYRISPDGVIAIKNDLGTKISLIYLDILRDINSTQYEVSILTNKKNEKFINVLFYPRGSILAIMSRNQDNQKTFMRYFDITKKLYIFTTELPNVFAHFFYFSPRGKRMILPYQKNPHSFERAGSFVGIVSFQIRYKCDTKEKFLYLSLVLNRIILQQETSNELIIPQDIINYIKKFSLKLLKR